MAVDGLETLPSSASRVTTGRYAGPANGVQFALPAFVADRGSNRVVELITRGTGPRRTRSKMVAAAAGAWRDEHRRTTIINAPVARRRCLPTPEQGEHSMVVVSVDGDRVRFEVEGWDKLWALLVASRFPSRTFSRCGGPSPRVAGGMACACRERKSPAFSPRNILPNGRRGLL
jgi:hypothetical protein